MQLNTIIDYLARAVFLIAAVAIPMAFLELAAQFFGKSVVMGLYSPGRLLTLSALLLVFVITVLLRQIRDELRARHKQES